MRVVPDRVRDEVLGLGVLPQHREEVLLLEAAVELELGLELGEQPLARPDRAVGGLGEPAEQLVRLGRAGLHQCPQVHRKPLYAGRGRGCGGSLRREPAGRTASTRATWETAGTRSHADLKAATSDAVPRRRMAALGLP
jgi:hypothetical protein